MLDLSCLVFDTMISNMKSDLEMKFANFIPKINNKEYTNFHPVIDLLLYALELDISLFDFVNAINNDLLLRDELEEHGAIIKIDTETIYNALKNSKNNKDEFPRS